VRIELDPGTARCGGRERLRRLVLAAVLQPPQPAPWIRDTRRSQGIHARPARLLSLRTHAATPDTQRTRDSRSRAADPDMGIRPTLDV